MLRMPAAPSKGATMVMRASCALASATCACATSSAAAFWSSALRLTKFCATSSRLRSRLVRAMPACAMACCSCACCSVSSSLTSNWPRRIRWPSENPSFTTRPLTSGRTITLCRERNVPTAWASSSSVAVSTLPTSTTAGPVGRAASGAAAFAADEESVDRVWYHHAAAPATEMPITATSV
jgi:hypothetical protein